MSDMNETQAPAKKLEPGAAERFKAQYVRDGLRKLGSLLDVHYMSLLIRRNGQDEPPRGIDWLKHLPWLLGQLDEQLSSASQRALRAEERVKKLEGALVEVELQVSSNEGRPTAVLANIGRIARAALAPEKEET